MRAYAVFAGGGVKGAALAGGVKAAEELEIEFLGYGGASAGSIIATLLACGYSGSELEHLSVENLEFTQLLDDGGDDLERVGELLVGCQAALTTGRRVLRGCRFTWCLGKYRDLLQRLEEHSGIYSGTKLSEKLVELAQKKIANFTAEFTFADLRSAQGGNWKPLKIISADIRNRQAVVFPDHTGDNIPIVDAVRASISYPFLFQPASIAGRSLVDGGLCSNLPAFLFESEAKRLRIPILAIDLVNCGEEMPTTFVGFAHALIETALDGSQQLQIGRSKNCYHVPLRLDPPVSTTNFRANRDTRRQMFNCGHSSFHAFSAKHLRPLQAATQKVETLQARYGSPDFILPILEMICRTVESTTKAKDVRAHISLPTLDETRIVTYQHGMDGASDAMLELPTSAGCSGQAYTEKRPAMADLVAAWENYLEWGMQEEHRNLVPKDRWTMMSVPIFDASEIDIDKSVVRMGEVPVIGTLSIDSTTDIQTTGWIKGDTLDEGLLEFLQTWAMIVGRILA